MICRYETRITALCPVNGEVDVYEAVLTAESPIQCENIVAAIKPYATTKMFQEDITAALAHKLQCRVSTVGYHSGVKTTVEAP